MPQPDPHSVFDPTKPAVAEVVWDVDVDFEATQLTASARLRFDRSGPAVVTLDTRDLLIRRVVVGSEDVDFALSPRDPVLGQGLSFALPDGVDEATVYYSTSPTASALQWLEATQTSGGRSPFLYSQSQTIHARSMIPLHDSMSARTAFEVTITAPAGLEALATGRRVDVRELPDGRRSFRYRSVRAMPPYLLSIVVAQLESRVIGPRSTIWAEPELIDAAAGEFGSIEEMTRAAEQIYGPFQWETVDAVVMPRSYPLGGMENPQLIYLTPTLLTGDGSAAHLLAHEIAHHWSGNLVSGSSLEHFWINEGITVYGERRIVEILSGRDESELQAAALVASIQDYIARNADTPGATTLARDLRGVDPDARFSPLSHLKGYLFFRSLEAAVGRDRLDPFIHDFYRDFVDRSLTTQEMVAILADRFGADSIDFDAWFYRDGLPESADLPQTDALDRIRALARDVAVDAAMRTWTSTAWQAYLFAIEAPGADALRRLDAAFAVSSSTDPEILSRWFALAVGAGMVDQVPAALRFVTSNGRLKLILPVYAALAGAGDEVRAEAELTYRDARSSYHHMAVKALDDIFIQGQDAALA